MRGRCLNRRDVITAQVQSIYICCLLWHQSVSVCSNQFVDVHGSLRWSNCDTVVAAGFPIKWYVAAWLGGGMIWDAFVLNVMLALTASVISARILRPIFQPND